MMTRAWTQLKSLRRSFLAWCRSTSTRIWRIRRLRWWRRQMVWPKRADQTRSGWWGPYGSGAQSRHRRGRWQEEGQLHSKTNKMREVRFAKGSKRAGRENTYVTGLYITYIHTVYNISIHIYVYIHIYIYIHICIYFRGSSVYSVSLTESMMLMMVTMMVVTMMMMVCMCIYMYYYIHMYTRQLHIYK